MGPRQYYTVFMLLALAVFLLARWKLTPPPRELRMVPWWKRAGLVLAGFVGGTLGAKLPFVLLRDDSWFTATAWISDGKTVTTALIGAYLGIELAKLVLDIQAKTGDSFALPLALALAVGRLGCFCNGCCYGLPTELPWGVDFGDGIRRHPAQLYEVVFHLGMAALLWQLTRAKLLRYQRLKLYLICYGLFRFFTEYLRPEPADWLGLTFYQWVALFLVAAMVIQWKIDARLTAGAGRTDDPNGANVATVPPLVQAPARN